MDVKLPPLGEGADSGTVVTILVREGEQVTKGQTILELETGKAVTPIPASQAGTVTKILVKEGSKISVGTPLLSLDGPSGGAAAAPVPSAAPAKKAAAKPAAARPTAAPVEETEAVDFEEDEDVWTGETPPPASPSLRKLAVDLGIDLKKIPGSGNGGRIVLEDFKSYIDRLRRRAAQARAAAGKAGTPAKPSAPVVDFAKYGPIAKRPMSPLRKVISQRMAESWAAVPRVTQFEEIDITRLSELRKKYASAYEKQGVKLTLTPFTLKGVVAALKKFPIFNTSIDEVAEEVIYKEYFHIGLAVDTEQGLIVPVIRDVDKKNLSVLSKEVNALAEKTRDRKISSEELQGGTFTISNQGGIGGAHFTPIVNRPEVAILGLGRGAMKPVVRDGKIEARLMLPVALSYDHRVIDGGTAVRFMLEIVNAFENFGEEEVKL
jgi:pyruvate dehydrogenase E2 component (dihydrolipoamide acetyltransferase)